MDESVRTAGDVAPQADVLMEPRRTRLLFLDAWRGLVIVLMVLDHVRDFFCRGALTSTPTEAGHTTAMLYATRWVTHLCAPTFLFLAGTGIRLQYERSGASPALSRYLLTRGAWLMLVDGTVVSWALSFDHLFLFVQVLYATGMSMMALAALVWLRPRVVLVFGGLLVLLAPVAMLPLLHANGAVALLRTFTLLPGPLPGGAGVVLYPFVPWLGVMCLGYGFGRVFLMQEPMRTRTIAWTAAGSLVLFAVLRASNRFGDLAPRKSWPDPLREVESFLNVSKYPPSPDYVLITLGVSLLLLLAVMRVPEGALRPLTTFGRTPLFTYVTHFYVFHSVQILVGVSLGYPLRIFLNYVQAFAGASFGSGPVPEAVQLGWGFPLWGTYLVWVAVVAMVYPLSRWFARVKQTRQDWWLRYL